MENKKRELTFAENVTRSITKKYRTKIFAPFLKALDNYEMIQEGDKIMVCISGGKDSFLLAKCLEELQRYSNKPFELIFVLMDPGFNKEVLQGIIDNANKLGIKLNIAKNKIFHIASLQKTGACYLCAKMRRGALYSIAEEFGANKVALGHHFSDVIETILLNVLYGAEFKTMMPKLKSTHHKGLEIIRPLYLVNERDIIVWKNYNKLEFIHCACPITDYVSKDQGEKDSKRKMVKNLIEKLRHENPIVEKSIFNSASNVNLNALISWKKGDKTTKFTEDY